MAGTTNVPRLFPFASKYCIVVGPSTLTSLNTTPKPLVSASVPVSGTTNRVSITFEPLEVNMRGALNGSNASM